MWALAAAALRNAAADIDAEGCAIPPPPRPALLLLLFTKVYLPLPEAKWPCAPLWPWRRRRCSFSELEVPVPVVDCR